MNTSLREGPFQNRIQVAVRPVGDFPSDKYNFYLQLLRNHCRVDLTSLTLHRSYAESSFPNLVAGEGSVVFEFVEHDGSVRSRQWEDFQIHRRILGVIGLCYLPSNGVGAVYDEYLRVKKSYPTALQFSLYAFEPLADQTDAPEFADLVLFPNQEERIGFYVQTFVDDLASRFISDFERLVHSCDERTILHSPLDSDKVLQETSKNKKMWAGRREKHIGDLCLLAGSPIDADQHYSSALDTCKSQNDWIWYGGALEGSISAILIDSNNHGSTHFNDHAVRIYNDALTAYQKRTFTFQLIIENRLRLARYYQLYQKYEEAATVLLRALEFSSEASAADQAGLSLECASLCMEMGLKRKVAFFVYHTCSILKELGDFDTRFSLIVACAPLYGLPLLNPTGSENALSLFPTSSSSPSASPSTTSLSLDQPLTIKGKHLRSHEYLWENGVDHPGRWVSLQLQLLEDMLDSGRSSQPPRAVACCISYCLRALHPWLDRDYQKSLAAELFTTTRTLPLNTCVDMSGIPMLVSVQPIPPTSSLVPVEGRLKGMTSKKKKQGKAGKGEGKEEEEEEEEEEGEEEEEDDVFLFSPNADTSGASPSSLTVSADETLHFHVTLSNPLQFEIVVQRIWLATEGVPFHAHPESLTLEPCSEGHRLLLSGRPMESGTLKVKGCFIRTFNLLHEHLVDEVGNGVPPLQPQLTSKELFQYGALYRGKEEVGGAERLAPPSSPRPVWGTTSNGRFYVVGSMFSLSICLSLSLSLLSLFSLPLPLSPPLPFYPHQLTLHFSLPNIHRHRLELDTSYWKKKPDRNYGIFPSQVTTRPLSSSFFSPPTAFIIRSSSPPISLFHCKATAQL